MNTREKNQQEHLPLSNLWTFTSNVTPEFLAIETTSIFKIDIYETLTKQMGVKTNRTLFYAEIVAYITTRNLNGHLPQM
jgi:hypothetical protein